MKLVLPVPPNRANARGHWLTIHRERGRYEAEVWKYILIARKFLPKEPAEFTSWQADFFLTKFYDADNLVSLCKWPIDTLVKGKIMKDDSPKHAWPSGFPTQTKCKKSEVRLELTLDFQSDNLTK